MSDGRPSTDELLGAWEPEPDGQCQSLDGLDLRCELPERHDGDHRHLLSWDNPPPFRPIGADDNDLDAILERCGVALSATPPDPFADGRIIRDDVPRLVAEIHGLRGRLVAVEALAYKWEREADEIRQSEGEERRDGPSAAMVGIAHGIDKSAIALLAALRGGE